jgi:amino acid adenylation domain-containing protein
MSEDLLAELSRRKGDVIAFLRSSAEIGNGENELGIGRAPREGLLPLSEAQQRLWFLDQLSPDSFLFVMSSAIRLSGKLDVGVLRKSLGEIVRRHESLRTVFPCTDGVPYAVILEPGEVEVPEVDLRDRVPAEREAEARRLAAHNVQEPFDLARGPLWRMKVLRIGEREHVLLCAVHHIVFDGWSVGVFMRELIEFYTAALEQRPPVMSPLPFQFADFAQWQRRRLEGGDRERNLAYWKAQLSEQALPLELPADRPRSAIQIAHGANCSLKLSKELVERLKTLSQREGVSLFMTLLAVFDLLLYRLTHQEDILVGTPVAGRDRTETEDLIGFFVNMVVMRADFREERTFRELLQQVRETALGAFAHQDMPYEELVAAVDPERDLSRTPLSQVSFNYLNLGIPKMEVAGLTMEPFGERVFDAKLYLNLYLLESDEGLTLFLLYIADMFSANRIQGLLEQYQTLLEQITKDPDRSVEQYSLVTLSAVSVLPDPTVPLEVRWEGSVQDRFLAQAAKRPEAVAISEPEGEWTYAELEQLSGGLSARLNRQGIASGDVVAIYAHRSAQLVLAMLGVLRAGAAFCILDPAYPESRLCRSFEAIQPKGWIQISGAGEPPESLLALVESKVGPCRLKLPPTLETTRTVEWAKERIPQRVMDPDSLAYVTFTSGTTGEPKCILGTHRPLSHFVKWHCAKFGLQDTDRFSMLSGLAHDPILRDIFTPLWLGATLCIPDPDEILEPGYLSEWMLKQRITVSHLTPPMGALIAESATVQLPALRYMFLGGELLTQRGAALLKQMSPAAQIVNFYGTTETPQAIAWHPIDSAQLAGCEENAAIAARPIPIGNSIADVQVLILNRAGGLAGAGELGEIFIRTPYLTLGYANDKKLTGERFVVNPFTGRNEDKLYRTGDLGRYRPDGIVELAGRADQQIKIRGYRVELGEIEAALTSHENVRKCVVVARKDQTEDMRLAAYVVAAGTKRPTREDLRTHLNTLLPDYMVPSVFTFLDAIPLTPNGKVDRGALPVPEGGQSSQRVGYVPPRNQVERIMAEIWGELLGIKDVGVFEHFFELGGHSLSTTRLIARLRSAFQVDLPLTSIFLEPTIAGLSTHIIYDDLTNKYIYVSQPTSKDRLVPAQPKGSRPPLFFVAGYMNPDDTLLILSRIFPYLGLDQPVYGFQPRWLDGHSEGYSSIHEVVAEFLAELRAFQPEGPYLLGGDCVGGILALEMARALLQKGQEVKLLVMSDTERPTAVRGFFANSRLSWRRGRHIVDVIIQLIRGRQSSRMQVIRGLVRRKLGTVPAEAQGTSAPDLVRRLRIDYRQMIYRHKLEKYPGRITLIVNEKQYKVDKAMGWKGIAQDGLEIISTPGNHWTRYTLHGKEFAERLLGCLERAQTERVAAAQLSQKRKAWKREFAHR